MYMYTNVYMYVHVGLVLIIQCFCLNSTIVCGYRLFGILSPFVTIPTSFFQRIFNPCIYMYMCIVHGRLDCTIHVYTRNCVHSTLYQTQSTSPSSFTHFPTLNVLVTWVLTFLQPSGGVLSLAQSFPSRSRSPLPAVPWIPPSHGSLTS